MKKMMTTLITIVTILAMSITCWAATDPMSSLIEDIEKQTMQEEVSETTKTTLKSIIRIVEGDTAKSGTYYCYMQEEKDLPLVKELMRIYEERINETSDFIVVITCFPTQAQIGGEAYTGCISIQFGNYVIKEGDTLNGISKRFHIGIEKLAQLNKINNPDYIEIGKKIALQ